MAAPVKPITNEEEFKEMLEDSNTFLTVIDLHQEWSGEFDTTRHLCQPPSATPLSST